MTKRPPRTTAITPSTDPLAAILGTALPSPTAPADPTKKTPSLTAGPLRAAYVPLAEAVSADKRAGYRETLCWVFDNSGTAPEDVDKAKIPSRGAVKLLDFAQHSIVNYTKFLDMHAKAVSDKGIAEAAAQAEYDERRQTTLLDGILGKYTVNSNTDGARSPVNDPPRANLPSS
jgi:hypothetical protein